MSNKAVIPVLVGMMLLTGVCNTLLTKYQDMQCVRDCASTNPQDRKNFEQPVYQTAQMFVGEMGCFLVLALSTLYARLAPASKQGPRYEPVGAQANDTTDGTFSEDEEALQPGVDPVAKPLEVNDSERKPLTGFQVILLALPASCDILGTTLMNVGLLFVAASIYQMTRGALVLFVGLFSVIFLRRHLSAYKWFALFIVVAGVAIVGLAGIVEQHDPKLPGSEAPVNDSNSPPTHDLVHRMSRVLTRAVSASANTPTPAVQTLIGILLIACAQIFTASQFVLEESIMQRYSIAPLAVVGWEGTFGLAITILAQIILHYSYGSTPAGQGGYFDARTGWEEMTKHRSIAVTSLLIMVSIGGFNYFGLSVTRSVSATSRSTIDTCRTLFIWVVSLGLGWETFKWLQVLGFAGLVYGTFLFNDIVRPPRIGFWRTGDDPELLPERPVEHS